MLSLRNITPHSTTSTMSAASQHPLRLLYKSPNPPSRMSPSPTMMPRDHITSMLKGILRLLNIPAHNRNLSKALLVSPMRMSMMRPKSTHPIFPLRVMMSPCSDTSLRQPVQHPRFICPAHGIDPSFDRGVHFHLDGGVAA